MRTIPERPIPSKIRELRIAAGLSQQQASDTVYSGLRTWQQWEAGDRSMHPAIFELFLFKTSKILLIG